MNIIDRVKLKMTKRATVESVGIAMEIDTSAADEAIEEIDHHITSLVELGVVVIPASRTGRSSGSENYIASTPHGLVVCNENGEAYPMQGSITINSLMNQAVNCDVNLVISGVYKGEEE